MANDKDMAPPSSPGTAMTDAGAGSENAALQTYPANQASPIAQLATELARQKSALQHAESALIARIGDVDDDRRHADMRLQRAWQTQYGEMSARVKRQVWFGATALLVCGVLIGLTLTLFYAHFDAAQQNMREEIAQLRIALDQQRTAPPDVANPALLIQDKLSGLSASIQAISASLAAMDRPPERAPAAIPAGQSRISPTETTVNQTADQEGLSPPGGTIGMTPATTDPPPSTPTITAPPAPSTPPAEPPRIDTPDPEHPSTNDQTVSANAEPAPTPQRILVGDLPYALQLIGFHSLDALQTFLDRFDLSSQAIYYREETHRGRPWFALIYSLHADREAAMAAIANLPAGLSRLDVWVRRLDPGTPLVVLGKAAD